MIPRASLLFAFFVLSAVQVRAQFEAEESGKGPMYGEPQTARYRVGVEIKAVGGPCKGLFATLPVPTDWPEQTTKVISENISPQVGRVHYRTLDNGVKQMLVEIPKLNDGEEAHALVDFEVTRRTIAPPKDVSVFAVPKRVERSLNIYLGPSPLIESRNPKIRDLARQATADKETAWEKVESIYDIVREKVEYKNGEIKGALAALRDGDGDCEEMTSLFIAMCRASGVPARTVWIPGHCYPEFYLVDDEGKGHWFPCQAAGSRAFGEMVESRPILQKGDNFRVPEKPGDRQRYAAEFLRGLPVAGGGKPKVKFVRDEVN